jgi:hypothetical protein
LGLTARSPDMAGSETLAMEVLRIPLKLDTQSTANWTVGA